MQFQAKAVFLNPKTRQEEVCEMELSGLHGMIDSMVARHTLDKLMHHAAESGLELVRTIRITAYTETEWRPDHFEIIPQYRCEPLGTKH